MSALVGTTGAEDPRLPSAHLDEPPRAVALLLAAWVILLEGALILVFMPVLIFTTKEILPPSEIPRYRSTSKIPLGENEVSSWS